MTHILGLSLSNNRKGKLLTLDVSQFILVQYLNIYILDILRMLFVTSIT